MSHSLSQGRNVAGSTAPSGKPAIRAGGASRSAFALGAALAGLTAGWAPGSASAQHILKAGSVPASIIHEPDRAPAAARRDPAFILVQGDGFDVADLTGRPGTPLPFQIALPPHRPTDYMLITFRGIPDGFALSSGFRAADTWLVSVREAEGLQLMPPADFVGSFTIDVQLSRGQGSDSVTRQVQVAYLPSGVARDARQTTAATSETVTGLEQPARAVPVSRIDPQKERALMDSAEAMLAQNDVTAARLIYARLAREGSIEGALTMARTFDPAFLTQYATTGLQPDTEKAKHWYGVAASLGSADASKRLLALDAAERR